MSKIEAINLAKRGIEHSKKYGIPLKKSKKKINDLGILKIIFNHL